MSSNIGTGKYYEVILQNIKENIMRDSVYTCTECGRLKNKDMDLSGTICNTCSTTNHTLDEKINKFTTLVQNFQFDIGIPRNQIGETQKENAEDVFTKPSVKKTDKPALVVQSTEYLLTKKRVVDQKQESKYSDESSQTYFSFHPLDDVSFVLNKKQTTFKGCASQAKTQTNSDCIKTKAIAPSNEYYTEKLDSAQNISSTKVTVNSSSPFKSNVTDKADQINICSNKKQKCTETDTEVIESSVDDWLMPRKVATSPLLFSPEAKDEDSDQDECVGATPTKDLGTMSTCNWGRGNQTVSAEKSNTTQDKEAGMHSKETSPTKDVSVDKTDEMGENEMEVDSEDISPGIRGDPINKNNENTSTENILSRENKKNAHISLEVTKDNKVEDEPNEEQLFTQGTQKISKHNLKIVISSLEDDESTHVDAFIDLFNPLVDSDVNQQTDFLIVGVDFENKVLRRTPKFLKAISLHTCIVNADYIKQCCLESDIVSLEKKFIPLDSSGVPGPVRSYIRQDHSLLNNFIFFSMERDLYLSSLIEFLIIQNGGKVLSTIKLFKAYAEDSVDNVLSLVDGETLEERPVYRKILLYGDIEEDQLTAEYKKKIFGLFKCHCFHYKSLFNVVACYDVQEFCAEMELSL